MVEETPDISFNSPQEKELNSLLEKSENRYTFSSIIAKRYQLIKKIGESQKSVVFKAKNLIDNRLVAAKTIHPALSNHPNIDQYVQKLRQEYETALTFNHPNLVPVYEFIQESKDCFFLIMDYIEGQSLRELINLEKPIEPHRAVKIILQLAEAVAYLHENQYYYLDLKPENVLLNNQGKVWLTDFGTVIKEEDLWSQEGKVFTTYPYADSKILVGLTRQTDRTTEVYSLGVMLYEMITGSRLSSDNTKEAAFVSAVLAANSPPEFPDGIPGELCNICLKCIQRKLSDSFLSVNELIASIQEFLEASLSQNHIDNSQEVNLIKRQLLLAWKLGVNLSKAFIYHSTYKKLVVELANSSSANNASNYNQIGMVILQEIGALESFKESQELALNINLNLAAIDDSKYHKIIRAPQRISIDEIQQLPKTAEEISGTLDKSLQDVNKHFTEMGEQYYQIFETRFLAGLWNLSNGLANQVLEMANQAPLPEECRSQLLELIEHSPKGISQEEINHTLDQIDRCVERYLLSVKS